MELPQAEPYKTGLKVNNTLKKSLVKTINTPKFPFYSQKNIIKLKNYPSFNP